MRIETALESGDLRARLLRVQAQLMPAIYASLFTSMSIVAGDAKANLDGTLERGGVNTGHYRASIAAKVQITANGIEATVGSPLMFGDEPAAAIVELGRRKGKAPPLAAIAEWVRKKPLEPTTAATRQAALRIRQASGKRGKPSRADFSMAIARVIQMHIAKFGTRPHPHLMPAFQKNRQDILDVVSRAVESVVSGGP